ncbi:class I SAM-dependent methyltransferase [Nonomuraea sp. MG754425]|uniref:class I SAM-dependent methyltransferase n=1 Tax=Nonomuraea sp. MG754425 TaxID=2570319 RepID=UPI001F213346|nr:class I SAM-dependent methyltransferase [Nonomuraea sp. MG754425]
MTDRRRHTDEENDVFSNTDIMDFYDPTLYERNVGLAPRVDKVYQEEVGELEPGSHVLELGCGIGDVLLPLAHVGYRTTGVDRSAAMLAHFRNRVEAEAVETRERVRLIEAELPALPDCGEFDMVLMPNDLVSHMLTANDARRLFIEIGRRLRPDGDIVLDVSRFDVSYLGYLAGEGGKLERVHGLYRYDGEQWIRVSEQSTYDPESGILIAHFTYEMLGSSGCVESTRMRVLRLHPRRASEIAMLLELSGFEVVAEQNARFPAGMDNVLFRARRVQADTRMPR